MRRTIAHYRKMVTGNPSTTFGISLAAQAVYAAGHRVFDSNELDDELYRKIFLGLKQKYGEALNAEELTHEMDEADSGGETYLAALMPMRY